MLKFEHLIQINDPRVPLITPLTREQLWRGLVMRAHSPTDFVMGLDSCVVQTQEIDGERIILTRVLDFGPFKVNDTVTLIPMIEVSVLAHATELWPRSVAIVRIEEPEPGSLYLRFIYELDLAEDSEDLEETVLSIRKQAYVAADLDTVQQIRAMSAVSGSLH